MKIKQRYFILGVGILCVLMIAIVIGSDINKKSTDVLVSEKETITERDTIDKQGESKEEVGKANQYRSQTGNYNYGEALQKAILFYELQRSGDLTEQIRCNWRGDSGLSDGKDVGLDLTGGWYDAGDHVKFNLPMAYTSTMLAWSVIEDEEVYKETNQYDYILSELRWVNDYLIKCHPKEEVYYFQVGDGGADHAFWGAAEILQMERPSYKVDINNPGSAVCGEGAAALAASSMVFKKVDSDYASTCLKTAKSLYALAEKMKGDSGYDAVAGAYYKSWSGYYDELAFAGAWLYLATGEEVYLEKAKTYADLYAGGDINTANYTWAHSWDDVHYGAALLLARITGEELYKKAIENNLDFWTVGVEGKKIQYTPKGLAWLDTWGSLRYATTTAFLASIYSEWEGCSKEKQQIYQAFALSQAEYALGSSGRSFMIGYGENYPKNPHHRTAHGGWENNVSGAPSQNRHILVGALVGGPNVNDEYKDERSDYTANEVACDYNAGFTGLLAKMYKKYGGVPIENLTAIEEVGEELYIKAGINAEDSQNEKHYIEVKALVYNHTAWPARVTDNLSFKYFLDLTDYIKAGGVPSDLITSYNNSSGKVMISKVLPWYESKHLYYVEVDLIGHTLYPGGQSEQRLEVQFRISGNSKWDYTQDYSYIDLKGTSSNQLTQAQHFALYDRGILVFGSEPGQGTPLVNKPQTTEKTNSNPAKENVNSSNNREEKLQTDGGEVELKQTNASNSKSNTINLNLEIKGKKESQFDLKDLSIHYYYTSDTQDKQQFWCDNAQIDMNKEPWYINLNSNISGKIMRMDQVKDGADHYLEIHFNNKDINLAGEGKITLGIRITNDQWKEYDQSNDYSYKNSDHIVIYYKGEVISGKEPK